MRAVPIKSSYKKKIKIDVQFIKLILSFKRTAVDTVLMNTTCLLPRIQPEQHAAIALLDSS
jgi:hypothetical protein